MVVRSMFAGSTGLVPAAFAVASVALAGCGRAEPARPHPAPQASARPKETRAVTAIEIVSERHRWRVRLADGPAVRDFVAQLPLQLSLKDYAGTEKIADLPRRLSRAGAPAVITPVKGDVAFYAPWGNLAIFYRDGHRSPGLVHLGRIVGSPSGLDGSREIEVTIRRPVEAS